MCVCVCSKMQLVRNNCIYLFGAMVFEVGISKFASHYLDLRRLCNRRSPHAVLCNCSYSLQCSVKRCEALILAVWRGHIVKYKMYFNHFRVDWHCGVFFCSDLLLVPISLLNVILSSLCGFRSQAYSIIIR